VSNILNDFAIEGKDLLTQLSTTVRSMDFLTDLAACSAALGVLVVLWLGINLVTRKTDDHHEMFVNRNVSYLIQRFSILVAATVAMYSSLAIRPASISNFWWVLASGGVFTAVMIVTYPIMRMVIGRNKPVDAVVGTSETIENGYTVKHTPRDPDKAVTDPISIGLVIGGFAICFGFVVNGVFNGSAPRELVGLLITVFTVLGVLWSVAWYFINDVLTRTIFHYSVRSGVRGGNITAGLEAFGMLVAQGWIMKTAISGDFTDWGNAFQSFITAVILVQFATYVGRWLIDKVILVHCTLRDVHESNNVELAAFLAGIPFLLAVTMSSLAASVGTL